MALISTWSGVGTKKYQGGTERMEVERFIYTCRFTQSNMYKKIVIVSIVIDEGNEHICKVI